MYEGIHRNFLNIDGGPNTSRAFCLYYFFI